MIPLSICSFLKQVDELDLPDLKCPYLYNDKSMMKLFLYSLIKGIRGFKGLRRHLEECPDVLRLAGLTSPPHRTTLGKRFKAMPEVVRIALQQLHQRFIREEQSDTSIMSVDSSLPSTISVILTYQNWPKLPKSELTCLF